MIRSVLIISLVVNAAIAIAQETTPTTPVVEPAVLQAAEDKYASEVSKAEAALAKVKRDAAAIRLKAYKDRLTEITKSGDFNKALSFKARIDQLEAEPESASSKQPKKPRPKDSVKFGGHTYALIKEPATWHVAKQRCEEMGGHLVCLNSSRETAFVASLCGTTLTAIGVTDELEEGRFLNVDGTIPAFESPPVDSRQPLDHWVSWDGARFVVWQAGGRGSYICEWDR